MNLQRGMRDKLDKYIKTAQSFEVTMDVQGSAVYDYCCFGVDGTGKLSDDRYMVFYNQPSSPKNEICYSAKGSGAKFYVILSKLPETIQRLVFTVSIDGKGTMGEITSHTVNVRQGNGEALSLSLSGRDFQREKAIISVEIYRKDVWRIAAVASGYNGGLGDLLHSYGGKEAPKTTEQSGKISDKWKTEVSGVISKLPGNKTVPVQGTENNQGQKTGGGHRDGKGVQEYRDGRGVLEMIYKATKLIQSDFNKAGIKCTTRELGELSFVEAGFTGKNCSVTIRFISEDNGNGVKALTDYFAKYPTHKLASGYEIINTMNKTYKYAKFTMNPSDGNICAEYDFPISVEEASVGSIATEIVLRFAQIVDDAYPVIMKNVWSR